MTKKAPQFVYVIGSWSSGDVKIGITTDLRRRCSMLQTGNPGRLEILWFTAGGWPLEQELHKRLAQQRSVGEWFKFDDAISAVRAVVGAALEILTAEASPRPSQRKRFPSVNRAAPRVDDVLTALCRFKSGATAERVARAVPCSADQVYPALNELRRLGRARVLSARGWWIAAETNSRNHQSSYGESA